MILSFLIALVTLVPSTAHAEEFLDIDDHIHQKYIEEVTEKGIVEGYGFGIFRPDISINRAEFLKILMLAAYGEESLDVKDQECFSDFTGQPQWFWVYACAAKERGIVKGYPDGTFRGGDTINLAEAMKITIEALQLETPKYDLTSEFWYLPYFAVGSDRGLFRYFPLEGEHLLTRSEMTFMIIEMDEPIYDLNNPDQKEIKRGKSSSSSSKKKSSSSSSSSSSKPKPVCGNGIVEDREQCDDGNLENGDGCSEICSIVKEPVRHGALRLDQRPISVRSTSAASKGVTLFAFDAIAGRQDVELTTLKFQSADGNLEMGQSYTLWVDSDADGDVDTEVKEGSQKNEVLTFKNLRQDIPEGEIIRFEVRADIPRKVETGEFSITFNFADPYFVLALGKEDARELSGVILNGDDCELDSICWIAVNAFAPQALEIQGRGNLFVYPDTTTIPTKQLLAGTEGDSIFQMRMRAQGEDIVVTDLKFETTGRIEKLLIYKKGRQKSVGTATNSKCKSSKSTDFCASIELEIEAEQEIIVYARPVLYSDEIGTDAQDIMVSLMASSFSGQPVLAEGRSSRAQLEKNNGDSNLDGEVIIGREDAGINSDILGKPHKTVFAKIASIENSGVDESIIISGSQPIAKFIITAADHENNENGSNRVIISEINFTVEATNVEFLSSGFYLYNKNDASEKVSCDASATSGGIEVTCLELDIDDINTSIDADKSISLVLEGLITDPKKSGSVASRIVTSLQRLSDASKKGTIHWTDEKSKFQWVDIGETFVRSTVYRN